MSFRDLVPLVIRLVQGEQAADAEQYNGDDEAEDVALPPVAERMLRSGASLRTPATNQ